ncbi:carbon storage regulator CsrA [Syntrophomonas erecta]
MLVLSRKKGETIIVGENIEITIIDVQGDLAKVGINAPKSMKIYRKEIYDEIKSANQEAIQSVPHVRGLEELKRYPKGRMEKCTE